MDFQFIPGSTVDVPEIPFQEHVSLPAEKTALIIVDMQNDFVKEQGTLVIPTAIDTIANITTLLTSARTHNMRVAYTQDTHFEHDLEWEIWPEHCRHNSWGWQIIDELAPRPGELVVQKNRYDGFYDTELDHYLTRVWDIENVVICGTVANICVLHTAGSAGLRWFDVVVPADGISALTTFDQALALRQVSWLYAGKVTRTIQDIEFSS